MCLASELIKTGIFRIQPDSLSKVINSFLILLYSKIGGSSSIESGSWFRIQFKGLTIIFNSILMLVEFSIGISPLSVSLNMSRILFNSFTQMFYCFLIVFWTDFLYSLLKMWHVTFLVKIDIIYIRRFIPSHTQVIPTRVKLLFKPKIFSTVFTSIPPFKKTN